MIQRNISNYPSLSFLL